MLSSGIELFGITEVEAARKSLLVGNVRHWYWCAVVVNTSSVAKTSDEGPFRSFSKLFSDGRIFDSVGNWIEWSDAVCHG